MKDRCQFYLTNKSTDETDYQELQLGGLYLYHHAELRTSIVTDLDNETWVLLGNAFSVDSLEKKPENDITQSKTVEVIQKTFNWSGRWALIHRNLVVGDSAGLMGLYYGTFDNQWMVSPSLNVFKEYYKPRFDSFEPKCMNHDVCHCFPAPGTRLDGVYRLFPSQMLSITDSVIKPTYFERIQLDSEHTYKEKVTFLSEMISTVIMNAYTATGRELGLALTSGYDSRVLLAAVLKDRIPFFAYTMQHDLISNADHDIPSKMGSKFEFPYKYVKAKHKPDVKKLEAYDLFCSYCIQEEDRSFYGRGQFEQLPKDALILKGGILDLIRGSQYPHFSDPDEMYRYIVSVSPDNEEYNIYHNSLKKWFDWVKLNPEPIDIRDRFDIEIFLGGWLSNLQQSVDLLDQTFIQICNSAAIISLILSFTEEERKSKQIYYDLYKELYPAVLDYPINPKERLHIIKYYYYTIKANPMVAYKKLLKKAETIFRK